MSTKYKAEIAYKQDGKLRKDYSELLNYILTNAAAIVGDTSKVINNCILTNF